MGDRCQECNPGQNPPRHQEERHIQSSGRQAGLSRKQSYRRWLRLRLLQQCGQTPRSTNRTVFQTRQRIAHNQDQRCFYSFPPIKALSKWQTQIHLVPTPDHGTAPLLRPIRANLRRSSSPSLLGRHYCTLDCRARLHKRQK